MSLRKANVLAVELEHALDEAGFRHHGTMLGRRLGSHRIRAGIYEAASGDTIWPYHYHRGIEEWLYVLSGEPVLRDPHGERVLAPGDVVCFLANPGGAHTVRGPGRFMIFSTGAEREPFMSVYPDSGKVSVPEGILLEASAVDYWYGEGTWENPPPTPQPRAEDPDAFPRPPIINVDAMVAQMPPQARRPLGFQAREARLGGKLGAEMLGATLYELDAGETTSPYHFERGREEWLLVLSGAPTLRHADGEDVLEAGDAVCFIDGPAGAHQLINRGAERTRLIIFSTMDAHSTVYYPDSGKLLIRPGDGERLVFRTADAVDYWDGETAPR